MTETLNVSALGVGRRWSVLVICALALFLVGLDTTIVTTGLTHMGTELGVDAGALSWVVDAYTVVFASLLVTAGALADRFGRRRVLRIGLGVFGTSSLLCAVAGTLPMLIVARAVQGVGASMLSPVALAIVVNVMRDPRERARAIGVWGAMFGLSMAAGPLTGGVLLAVFDWRALFWINVPLVLIVLVLVALVVPETRGEKVRRFDVPGQLLLTTILGIAVGVLIEGPGRGWQDRWVLSGIVVLVVLVWVFIRVESRRQDPLIDPGLFRIPSFTGAILGAVAVFVAFSMTLLLTTRIVRESWGWAAIDAGALTLPMALGATVFAPVSGLLVSRNGPRRPLIGAGALPAAGGACLLIAVESGEPLALVAAYLLVGSGIGCANAPITNTAVSGLPPERAGVAGGTASAARQVGTALGIAIAGSLLTDARPEQYAGASLPGWSIVAACGLLLIMVGTLARRGTHPRHAE
ncbi:drug resistance transporter, EmrB/QacA subfamily [Streptomyces zhaozhouensis]|uniref:Drug resistance transporter, EmrB/QacA subfamily n=1 Tax=Streptomyces zhaozhouensis TaxID=1300267 RepID=A0A286DVQ7_9ACTN|nr:MFS transporter [Streptomyces zhaozhouensis]SOD62769.1 drug resistance transporter, EmrB/QacA subfamily [Streptomyces zhaozhouensis]